MALTRDIPSRKQRGGFPSVSSLPFVGRAGVLDLISDPPTPASVIFGEAGAGKTRVLTEARARAHDRRIATVVCQRGASLLPLEPLISLVRALQRDGAIAATDRDRVVDAAECDRLAYIREALERAASEPVVFQIDDLHWADAATPDAIRYCIDRLVDLPVTWHLTSRLGSPVIDDFAFGLERAGQAQIINLDSLSLEELRTLAVSVHPGKTIDDVALARLYERTGGNPLYAEMLLATPQADQAEIPRTLRWALHDRLAALSGEAADVAAWIAVHRGSLKQGEVAALSRYSPAQVLASLTELQEKGVLRKTQDGFSFRHELLRDVCYETLDEDIRAARHRELADRSPDEWQRAGHFDGARRYEEAAAILIGIGWDRLDRDAPSESLAAFSRALERLNPDVENAWEARAGLAAATVAVGEIDSAREHMQEFERRAAGLSSRLRVLARSRYAEAAWTGAQDLTSEIPQLESSVAEGIAAAPDLLPRLFCILGSAYERRGDLPAAQVALERGLAYADPDAQQREYIRLRAWLGVVLGRLGRAREGIAMLEEAAERAASLGMANELATCCGKLCYVCNMVADNERYEYWCRRGIDAAGPKSRRTQAGLMINLACVSIDKGRLQEALGLSIAAAANVDPSSSAAVRALHVQAHLFAMLGDAESAQRIVADLYAHTAPAVTKRVDFTAGYCAELRRDLESALSNYERAAAFGSSLDEVDQLEALTGMVRVASALNHRDAAKRALERLRSANRHGWPVLKMLVREAEGFIKLLAGDVTHACEDLLAAAELNQDRFWRAHLRLIVADARADRALFLEVIDEFDALGAATEGDRARSLARTHGLRPGRKREAHGVLSEREISVALLVASGKTNAEIGELLHVSPRTVEYHLTNILGKSGLRSRVEIAIKVAAGTLLGGSSETTTA